MKPFNKGMYCTMVLVRSLQVVSISKQSPNSLSQTVFVGLLGSLIQQDIGDQTRVSTILHILKGDKGQENIKSITNYLRKAVLGGESETVVLTPPLSPSLRCLWARQVNPLKLILVSRPPFEPFSLILESTAFLLGLVLISDREDSGFYFKPGQDHNCGDITKFPLHHLI